MGSASLGSLERRRTWGRWIPGSDELIKPVSNFAGQVQFLYSGKVATMTGSGRRDVA